MQNFLFSQKISRFLIASLLAAMLAILAGCGSGSTSGGAAAGTTAASGVGAGAGAGGAAAVTQTITGTAATGAPLTVGSTITIEDKNGKFANGTTDANGKFTVAVTGLTPPFMLRASDPTKLGPNSLYSFLSTMDMTATSTANVNITPFTTLVMYELSGGNDPGIMFRDVTFTAPLAKTVGNAEQTVRNNLAGKLPASAVLPSNDFSLMYGSFPADGVNVYDKALDAAGKIITPAGKTTAYASGGVTLANMSYAATAPTTAASTATSVQLLLSSTQMASAGGNPVTMTAIVLDAAGQTMKGRTVTFSKGVDSTAYISNVSNGGVSDASGVVTANLNLGTNKANRTISVSATADSITANGSIDVTGTSISISGNSSLALGASTKLTISVKDSIGTAMQGIAVTVASQNSNTVTQSSGVTDSSGQITATVTATVNNPTDTITVTAAGASKIQALTISSASFAFTAPPITVAQPIPQIDINASQPTSLSVLWQNAGANVADGTLVNFNASRGAISGVNPTATLAGVATASISSTTTGPAIITAMGAGGTPATAITVEFITHKASNITAQANPGTVQITTGSASQTSNSSTISVMVRDAANNLVKDALVSFTIASDPSGGSLSSATAITDSYGSASVSYTAGKISTAQNGVHVNTTVTSVGGAAIAPVTNFVELTVSAQALEVRLGTDNTVVSDSLNGVNRKRYTAIVTDAAGNPVPGIPVQFKLRPNQFFKGWYVLNDVKLIWEQHRYWTCENEDSGFDQGTGKKVGVAYNGILEGVNEDTNKNGVLDPGEDTNGNGQFDRGEDYNNNGQLDPGNIASVDVNGITDANGLAITNIVYAKQFSSWASFILEARVGFVAGNDPPATASVDPLPGYVNDYNVTLVSPPGLISPFGLGDPFFDTDPKVSAKFPTSNGNNTCTNPK